MKISKKDIALYLFSVIGITFILYLLIVGNIKRKSLERNLEYTKAIVDKFYAIKHTDYLGYKFVVNEREYHGNGRYYSKSDTLSIGDTIVVVYDKVNPSNNKTYRDYK